MRDITIKVLSEFQQLPRGHSVGALLLLLSLSVSAVYLTTDSPEAALPPNSIFYNPSPERWNLPENTFDGAPFLERPLFNESRRPDLTMYEAVEPVTTKAEQSPQTLEGVTLLGIFGSGEVKGAIIRQADGSKGRFLIGAELDVWRLDSVSDRSAHFVSADGLSTATISMTLAEVEPALVQGEPLPAEAGAANGLANPAPSGDPAGEAAEAYSAEAENNQLPTTFEAIYSRRYNREKDSD